MMTLIGLINTSTPSRVASYKEFTPSKFDIKYWRTNPGLEVDFILAHGNITVEAKISQPIKKRDIKGLMEFSKEYISKRSIVVSLELKRE
jgi:predicted AAA+ superfamily ATPase